MLSFRVNYGRHVSSLCVLGAQVESQQKVHRYPYTLFYHALLHKVASTPLKMAEIGIFREESVRMWHEFLPNVSINYVQNSIDETTLEQQAYDFIIQNTNDQQVLAHIYNALKPGGVLVVEAVLNEEPFQPVIKSLQPQTCFFLTLEHANGCQNDKLLVLVKPGPKSLFRPPKLTIITPCARPQNLKTIFQGLDFAHIDEWIIVYDSDENPLQFARHSCIREVCHRNPASIVGNAQRNFALDLIAEKADAFVYFLDDDNMVHPSLYAHLVTVLPDTLTTFDMQRSKDHILYGNNFSLSQIDTAMVIVSNSLIKSLRWEMGVYAADFMFFNSLSRTHADRCVYIPKILATYNSLR